MIVIDDGSTNGVQDGSLSSPESCRSPVHYFPENRGKREALHVAVTRLLDDDVKFL